MIIDFGCKTNKVAGTIGVDIDPTTDADVIHDFNVFPYPFEDNVADKIFAMHIIEHIQYPREFLEEIYRILKPGGTAIIETPHFSSYVAYSEPEHLRYCSLFMFRNLLHCKARFEIPERVITFNKIYRRLGIAALANKFPYIYERFWVWICPAENVRIIVKKDGSGVIAEKVHNWDIQKQR